MAGILQSQIQQFNPDIHVSSVSPRWQFWLTRLENYFNTFETEPASAKKLAILLHCAGPGVLELYQTVKGSTVTETDAYEKAKIQLATLFNPKRNRRTLRVPAYKANRA